MVFKLLTFGGPTEEYYAAMNRLKKQAEEFGIFDEVICVTDKDLSNDEAFWSVHKDFVLNNRRGYGYWLWKPYLIWKTLLGMRDGDILMYADCGCELNIKGRNKMNTYIELTKRNQIIGTSTTSNDINYTKRDLVNKFFGHVNERNVHLLLKGHMQAGCLMILKNETTLSIFKQFYDVCCDYKNIDDTPSVALNDKTFVEHRHDQSVFNMIMKKNGMHNYMLDPAYFHPNWNNYGRDYPIWYCRNKTGVSKIEFKE